MAKITVEVPQSAIDEKTKKALESANRKIKTLEQKVAQLEMVIQDQKDLVAQAQKIKDFMKETYMLHSYEDCEQDW